MRMVIMVLLLLAANAYSAEPLIDEYQLRAVEAHEKINKSCDEKENKDEKIDCLFHLSQGKNQWPLPYRGTKEYCQEQYAGLSHAALEEKFKEIEALYEQARYFPIGSSQEPERGEITKGDLNVEIRCISDYMQ